jgi:hypothetical protein
MSGAPFIDSDQDMMSFNNKKRKKMNVGGGNKHEGLSEFPTDKDTVKHVAFALSVLPAVARILALMNKSADFNCELSRPSVMFFDWFLSFATNFLDFAFGATQFSDMQRIMQGYLSRSVALSLLVTTAMGLRRFDAQYRGVLVDTMSRMESGALSLHMTSLGLIAGLGRMVDPNLLWVNSIASKLILPGSCTPVLDLDWLCVLLDGRDFVVNAHDRNYIALHRFLSNLQMQGEYAVVPMLADIVTYYRVQQYLEKYNSIPKESFPVYISMIHEAAHKIFHLETLLNVDEVSLRLVCQRMGVRYEDRSNPDPENNGDDAFLYLRKSRDPKDPIRDCFVHVVGHLWILAMQGPYPLHSESVYRFAERLFAWVVRRFVPAQVIPSGVVFTDLFQGKDAMPLVCVIDRSYVKNDVSVIDYGKGGCGVPYFLRTIDDPSAWENEQIGNMPPFIGNYLPEDTMHMGSMMQLYERVMQRKWVKPFTPLPGITARGQELFPTRCYPLLCGKGSDVVGGDSRGVICICPNGFNFVLMTFSDPTLNVAVPLDQWQLTCEKNCLAAGPLIHRPNAVVVLPESRGLGLIVPRSDDPFEEICFETLTGWSDECPIQRMPFHDQCFLDAVGEYKILDSDGDFMFIHNLDIELLQVGKHILVKLQAVFDALQSRSPPLVVDVDDVDVLWIRGWLRYPDECDDQGGNASDPHKVYVVFKFARGGGSIVLGVCLSDCALNLPEECDDTAQAFI